jgi:hypothetical protein
MMEFETELRNIGYVVSELNKEFWCEHKHDHFLYVQSPYEYMDENKQGLEIYNKNIYLEWEKRPACESCIKAMICNLDCSGLYTNVRIFKNGQNVTTEYWGRNLHFSPRKDLG